MATAEEVYPKVGNDPIFASELNWYRRGFAVFGSTFDAVGSSTDGLLAGSLIVGAGSLSNPCLISIFAGTGDFAGAGRVRVQISGADADIDTTVDCNADKTGGSHAYIGQGILGTAGFLNSLETSNTAIDSINNSFTMNPGSGFVVNFLLQHPMGGDLSFSTSAIKGDFIDS